ncbi:MAG: TRAP transporter large permease [Rhodobacteraceae bacterium]|nr:TRAP transporter large permease [Paracoccaceae bacterium]
MSGLAIAGVGIAALLVMLALRVPIAAAMALTGFAGTWAVLGSPAAGLSQLKSLSFDTFASHSLSIIPLFLLMGQIATRSGISAALYQAAADWLGHRRGGLAMATVGASAGFGAICGSSLATASTVGQVALPEMRSRGYSDRLSTGVLAAGGTLGILIPPSIVLVIYAILTEQNIVKMFAAAFVPGLLAVLGYLIAVALTVRLSPGSAQPTPRVPVSARWRSLAKVWPAVAIFALVMGGMVGDWNWARPGTQALFTPTEAAAVGALAMLVYGIVYGGLRWRGLSEAILETASATGFIFLILLGAQMFNTFLAYTQTPQALAEWVQALGIAPLGILAAMLLFYLVLGCVMDSLSMILLTIPVFFPIIAAQEFGLSPEEVAIWFGILVLIAVEVGLITPPVGLNLFIINRLAPDVPLRATYLGVLPFLAADLVRVGLLLAVPGLTLWAVGWIG